MKDIEKLKLEFFASCPTGLEELLYKEINSLGVKSATMTRQGVLFEAYNEIALKVLLHSRFASRVFRRVFEFDIKKEKDLYIEASKIKWKAVFPITHTFKITTVQGKSPDGNKRSNFKNSFFLSQLLKDSICDWFRKDSGERPNVELDRPDIHLSVHIAPYDNPYATKEKVTIMVDLSGSALSNRGYRQNAVEAPMRENLAAAIITMADVKKEEPFYDLMTGSGTIIIEAALMKGNIPPSFIRVRAYRENYTSWAFLNHLWFTKDKLLQENFEKLLVEVENKTKSGIENLPKGLLFASDNSRGALKITRQHLEDAGLASKVQLSEADVTEVEPETSSGVVLINPPYGERMGEKEEVEKLYHDIGENFKKSFKGFRAYVFTGDHTLLKKISLRTSKKIILHNGNLEGRLAEYLLY